ncbi:IS630 family transposase [Aeromonas veronii]
MNIKYVVELTKEERELLQQKTSKGQLSARELKRINILLMADDGRFKDQDIAEALTVGTSTVYRTKRDFVESGLAVALQEGARPGGKRLLDMNQEALLVSLACSEPPVGRCRWTLTLLGERLVALSDLESVSIETIRRRLKDKAIKPWQKKMWCLPALDAEFIAQMEHVLDLYTEPANEKRPVVNFDEAMKQLVADTREPIPMKPGQAARQDYEYCRKGVANLFVFFDRHRGWRKVKPTLQKRSVDFADCMRDLVDIHYPEAEVIRVVLDNLSTHKAASLYKAFPAEEARRILRRLEFHYTPKHASWLNMVEIEIGNMNQQCLVRIPVKLNSDSGICEHHFRKVCGQGVFEQKLSFEGRHLFDSPNKPAAKRSAAVVDPRRWNRTVHLTSDYVL